MTRLPDDAVTQYAQDVLAGRVVVGRLVRLACQRHVTDLDQQETKGLVWKPTEAQRAIRFFQAVLCLPEETASDDVISDDVPLDGSPFELQPWQQFLTGSLFGWYTTRGYRRFRDAYVETAKGAGKTPWGAGVMLYMLVADGERGAQCYFAATTMAQAKEAGMTDAVKMVRASPALRDLINEKVNNLAVLETGSFLRAISSEKRGLDGKRVHGAFIDEEHEHRTPVVVGKVRRGTKGRRNALVIRATNSGFDRTSICWHDHEHSRKVLEGAIVDEAWFAYVCGLDPCPSCQETKDTPDEACPHCDDWRTEGPHWLKACPNLGVSVSWQYHRELVTQAKARPDVVSDLLRFNFCVWTQAQSRAINMAKWRACQPRPSDEALVGLPCYGGLDLGQSDDFSAWVRLWDLEDGRLAVKCRFWLPEAALEQYPDRPYAEWRRAGVLTVTEGDTTDYDVIEATVQADCNADGIREVAYDNRFALQLAQHLSGAGLTMVNTPQGFALNEAIRKKLELITTGKLCHGDDPILTWMASNYVLRHGLKGDIRPDKDHAADKVDGQVALDMAIDRVVRQPVERPKQYQVMFFGGR